MSPSGLQERRARHSAGDRAALHDFERGRLALFARHGFEGESRWVADRDGRRTYLVGRGEGPCPTVLVHGGLSQAGEWAPLAGLIPGHVLIPDRPGCGISYRIDYRRVPDYQEAAAAWMLDLVDGAGAEQVDLVGSSMGGFFSIAFALAHPKRVRSLVLVGAPAGLDRKLPLFPRLWGNPIVGPLIGKLKITDPEAYRDRIVARLLAAHPESVSRELLDLMVASGAIPGADRAAHTMLRTVTTLRGWRRELMMRDAIATLHVPTLFVWGDADAFAPPSSGHGLAARMRDARVKVVRDAGHLPWIDHPEAVAAAVVEFLLRSETAQRIPAGRVEHHLDGHGSSSIWGGRPKRGSASACGLR